MAEGWIWQQNLWPFVQTAASFVGNEPDEYDRMAIGHGLRDTDVEQERWFSYVLGNGPVLHLAFAADVGTEVLFVRADAGAEAEVKLAVSLQVFQNYRVAGAEPGTA